VVSDVGYPGYLEIPLLVVEGYGTLYQEVDEQLAAAGLERPDVVLIPGGVGGILHAGVAHLRSDNTGPMIVAVEPAEGDCLTTSIESPGGAPAVSPGNRDTSLACLNCAEVSLPSWPAIRRGVDVFVALDDAWAEEAVRRLHRAGPGAAPIAAGNSGAAATGALLALTRDDRLRAARDDLGLGATSVVLALCTEGPIDRQEFDRVLAEPNALPL
jgi:diaminopropionate ammonia-lyase